MLIRLFRWLISLLLRCLFGKKKKERGGTPSPGPVQRPPGKTALPSRFTEQTLIPELCIRLMGTPADGSTPAGAAQRSPVVWVDGGDELLVYLDSLQVRILDRFLIVSIDLETDQTGKSPMVLRYAVGGHDDPAGLVAVSDEVPHGHPLLIARWGEIVQSAVWATLLGLARAYADEREHIPTGITTGDGELRLHSAPAIATSVSPGGGSR